ncbi:MAG: two component transcriptional regulator, LuxR family [Firmicutes bacterium]|jgi:DNA-binding NarL/FixJ family response regulator|uniref:Two component transcriptional regulator, LuxR family n=1 Tax=Pelosinus fermentans JBW45 TaxID=1192197 RepID=I9DFC2_9FIRM|nr:response regulator transcription factor [Pelosinus fermentans]AJQ28305.1 two component transcriptional regulator, LuxR family [Pelosinus fermentans JBW45]MBP2658270.1 two component transcriptional regulator, LuxR family [Bacillota bacterium]
MIKVLIVEDQEIIRQSLEIMLHNKAGIQIVGTAENGKQVARLVKKLLPDVILMDIRMPEMDGVRCIEIIKEAFPKIKIIVLTTFDDDEYVFNALKNGASGYLLKGISVKELVEAIKIVYGGGALINPNIAVKVFKFFSQMANADYLVNVTQDVIEDLSKNELRIIQFVGMGMSNKEITEKLKFSEGTIRNYISSILSKLSLRDRTQIAIYAVQSGLTMKEVSH